MLGNLFNSMIIINEVLTMNPIIIVITVGLILSCFLFFMYKIPCLPVRRVGHSFL
jgi:hypothetical protein